MAPRLLTNVLAAAVVTAAAVAAVTAATRTAPASRPTSAAAVDPAPSASPAGPPARGWRRWARSLLVVLGVAAAVACGAVAWAGNVPPAARWSLGGAGAVIGAALLIWVLIGPLARRLAGERAPLTEAERGELTAHERMEAVNAARHTMIQAATGLLVVGGLIFTALGLRYTADTLDTSRKAQALAEQGQITDRYTKAAEQLGSDKTPVRLASIYALQRLATDSPRDKNTIREVLSAYVRSHDLCAPTPDTKPPLQCTATGAKLAKLPRITPPIDTIAALTVAPLLNHPPDDSDTTDPRHPQVADFRRIRFPGADLTGLSLIGTNLTGANLAGANLTRAYLASANLTDANLTRVHLGGADLTDANLAGADLNDAYLFNANLAHANLTHADLTGATLVYTSLILADLTGANLAGANLTRANLAGANLTFADLTGANLAGANLTRANLTNANLRGAKNITELEIRRVAIVSENTLF